MIAAACALTQPSRSVSNGAVVETLATARLLVTSYVVCENAKALSASGYAFFADVFEAARPGTLLLALEATHRPYPELIEAARRGVERANVAAAARASTEPMACALEVGIYGTKGRGGSQCVLLKRLVEAPPGPRSSSRGAAWDRSDGRRGPDPTV